MVLDTVCLCPSKAPEPLAFNHNPISTQRSIVSQLKSKAQLKKLLTKHFQKNISWIVAFGIVAAVSVSNIVYAGKSSVQDFALSNVSFILGGPEEVENLMTLPGIMGVPGEFSEDLNLVSELTSKSDSASSEVQEVELPVISALNSASGYADEMQENKVVRNYTTQEGDSLNSVAERFGISAETIAITNDLSDLNTLPANKELVILPVDGIRVNMTSEERSLEELAKVYQVSLDDIKSFNEISEESVELASLIIPNAVVPNTEKPFYVEPVQTAIRQPVTSEPLPVTDGYYGYPTTGRNYGRIHSNNGIDIANSCGTPIYASASGVVTLSQDGWNGGYGSYIKVQHDNGTTTVYAHLSQRNSQVGQTVAKGELIGLMGTTGRSTGCHIHFEVRGARNPFGRY
jgi:murein DD-endopeptidase MepM/ murein hydrolase activator NlpD